jgi:hypothetical protein
MMDTIVPDSEETATISELQSSERNSIGGVAGGQWLKVKWIRAAGPLKPVLVESPTARYRFVSRRQGRRLLLLLWACGQRGSVVHHVHPFVAVAPSSQTAIGVG